MPIDMGAPKALSRYGWISTEKVILRASLVGSVTDEATRERERKLNKARNAASRQILAR
jgi:hypothetical protein